MARKGPKSKLTEETQKAILDKVAEGVPLKYAALSAGISERAVRQWVAYGQKSEQEPYHAFATGLKKAIASAVAVRVGRIATTAANGTWTADAWWLERMAPEFSLDKGRIRELEKRVKELEALLVGRAGEPNQATRTEGPGIESV